MRSEWRVVAVAACLAVAGCSDGPSKTFSTRGLKAPVSQCMVNPHELGDAEAIRDIDEGNGCEVRNAWRVKSVSGISFSQPAVMNCGMIGPLDHWMTESVQPAAQRTFGESVVGIDVIDSYSCRPQNGIRGARMSEHGFGNAIDIASFTLESGRKIKVEQSFWSWGSEKGFLREVRTGACADFKTILGPGDPHHDDHIHLDRANRSKTLCE